MNPITYRQMRAVAGQGLTFSAQNLTSSTNGPGSSTIQSIGVSGFDFYLVGVTSGKEYKVSASKTTNTFSNTQRYGTQSLYCNIRWTGTGMIGTWHGYAVGASGVLYSSMGSEVGYSSTGVTNTFYCGANIYDVTILGGTSGRLRRTTGGGFSGTNSSKSWANLTSGTTGNFLGATTTSDGAFVFVGSSGIIRRVLHNSTSVSTIASPAGSTRLNGIASNGATVIAVGASGTIIRSTNNGASFSSVTSGVTNDLYSVTEPCNVGYPWVAVGASGIILFSFDDGVTWEGANTELGISSSNIFYAVKASDPTYNQNTYLIAGTYGEIHKVSA